MRLSNIKMKGRSRDSEECNGGARNQNKCGGVPTLTQDKKEMHCIKLNR